MYPNSSGCIRYITVVAFFVENQEQHYEAGNDSHAIPKHRQICALLYSNDRTCKVNHCTPIQVAVLWPTSLYCKNKSVCPEYYVCILPSAAATA